MPGQQVRRQVCRPVPCRLKQQARETPFHRFAERAEDRAILDPERIVKRSTVKQCRARAALLLDPIQIDSGRLGLSGDGNHRARCWSWTFSSCIAGGGTERRKPRRALPTPRADTRDPFSGQHAA